MRKFLSPPTLLAVFVLLSAANARAERQTPNILFILADDLAWSDIGAHDHPWHRTPHIDALVRSGVDCTSGYAPAPICSASRASILTGKTTARLGFEFVTKSEPQPQRVEGDVRLTVPPLTLDLPLEERTIAEYLNDLGYTTAFFGKWHVSRHHGRYLGWSPTHGPRAQGFQVAEEDFGSHPYDWKRKPPATIDEAGRFPEDTMVDRICDFVSQDHDRPYFVMASSFFVHTPVKTPCAWLTEHYSAAVPADSPNRSKRVTYAAFVETLDHHVGRIVDAARASERETLIVFLSDNGGHPEFTTNAPLRGSKWNLYEGGIRVPFVASWPGVIPAGAELDRAVVGYDLLPTFVEIAGGDLSDENLDGKPLLNAWRNGSTGPTRRLYWHFPYYHPEQGYQSKQESIGVGDFAVSKTKPHSAMRRGRYKLLWFAEDDRVELYNVVTDPSERHDLSGEKEHLANCYRRQLEVYLDRVNARRAVDPADAVKSKKVPQ